MMSDRVHIHMTEADSDGIVLGVDGYTGREADNFENWAWQQIDEGLGRRTIFPISLFSQSLLVSCFSENNAIPIKV